jgi:hypothetical protein
MNNIVDILMPAFNMYYNSLSILTILGLLNICYYNFRVSEIYHYNS